MTQAQFAASTKWMGIDSDCPVCGYSWPGCQGQCVAHVSGNGEPGPYHDDYSDDCVRCHAEGETRA